MRVLIAFLLLSGCSQNLAVLEATEADLERRLAASKARVEILRDLQAQTQTLERELTTAAAERPEAREALAQLETAPLPPGPALVFPPLPPESFFEGGSGMRARVRISALEIQLSDLATRLEELEQLDARRKLAERKLELLRGLPAAQK